jgi:hypothetical protein
MKKLVALFATAIGISAAAIAQEMPAFDDVDQNADGLIDQTEASAVEGLDFAAADSNQDGSIDRAEYEQAS